MDWNQIESKWAAMTRRVRGGLPHDGTQNMTSTGLRPVMSDQRPSLVPGGLGHQQSSFGTGSRSDTTAE